MQHVPVFTRGLHRSSSVIVNTQHIRSIHFIYYCDCCRWLLLLLTTNHLFTTITDHLLLITIAIVVMLSMDNGIRVWFHKTIAYTHTHTTQMKKILFYVGASPSSAETENNCFSSSFRCFRFHVRFVVVLRIMRAYCPPNSIHWLILLYDEADRRCECVRMSTKRFTLFTNMFWKYFRFGICVP